MLGYSAAYAVAGSPDPSPSVADELIARRDFVAFSENWVKGHPRLDQECLLYRGVKGQVESRGVVVVRTLSDEAYLFLFDFCATNYNLTPMTINDKFSQEFLIEVLDAAILAAKEAGL